jgi:hypothetical protein
VGGGAGRLAAGDLNGDGRADLVVTRPSQNGVRVLLGDPASVFTSGGAFGIATAPAETTLVDFNEDARLDLAVAGSNQTVVLLDGDGAGGFGNLRTLSPGGPVSALAAADFDLDGHQDLALALQNGSLAVHRGNGQGAFTATPPVLFSSLPCTHLLAVDLTADQRPDLACRSGTWVWVLLNTAVALSASDPAGPEGNATGVTNVTVSLSHAMESTVTVGHATSGGTATGGADYVPTAGTLTFPPGTTTRTVDVTVLGDRVHETDETIVLALSPPPGITPADLEGVITLQNDDPAGLSIADVAVREATGGDTEARFTVRLAPAAASTVTVDYGTVPGSAAAGADFTPVSGQLTFAPGATSQPVVVPILQDSAVETAETFSVALSGAVNADIAYGAGTGVILDRTRGADFNADGTSDLVWRHAVAGQNVLWFMNGVDLVSGTFTDPPVLADARWRIVGTNDFNADGQADLLWRHATSGENVFWFMNGATLVGGTFSTPAALEDVRWQMVGTGDFNLDGRPDILWRHDTAGQNVLWYMNGTVLAGGTFTTPSALTDVRWKMAGTGDFDRDGKPDILWHHTTSGQTVLWYMDGAILVGGTFTDPPGLADVGWRVVAVADYNFDEKPDIVWRHQTEGQNVVWFMDDATLISGTFTNPSTLPDLDWKLVGPR